MTRKPAWSYTNKMKTNMPVFGKRLRYICCSYFQITSTPRQSFSKKSRLQLLLENAKGGRLGGVTQCNAYCPTFVGNSMEHSRLQSVLLHSDSYSKFTCKCILCSDWIRLHLQIWTEFCFLFTETNSHYHHETMTKWKSLTRYLKDACNILTVECRWSAFICRHFIFCPVFNILC